MKHITFFILAFVLVNCSYGQKNGFGIHGGLAATGIYDLADGYDNDFEPNPGIVIGARYNLKFGPLGFCYEINYISKQYSRVGYTNFYNEFIEYLYPIDYTQNYISMPLLLKIYAGPVNIHGGVQTSYLLGGFKHDQEMGSSFYSDPEYYSTIGGTEYWAFEDIDFALVFGLGLDLNIGLYMACRATVSITPITNMDMINATNDELNNLGVPDFYTSQFIDELGKLVTNEITIGYRF